MKQNHFHMRQGNFLTIETSYGRRDRVAFLERKIRTYFLNNNRKAEDIRNQFSYNNLTYNFF
jgi:hypothetical protein